MKKIVAIILICMAFQCSIVLGSITITYGEVEKSGNKNVEVNAVGTGQGFILKDKNYKEGLDYLVFINNRGTSKKSDDKLISIYAVTVTAGLMK